MYFGIMLTLAHPDLQTWQNKEGVQISKVFNWQFFLLEVCFTYTLYNYVIYKLIFSIMFTSESTFQSCVSNGTLLHMYSCDVLALNTNVTRCKWWQLHESEFYLSLMFTSMCKTQKYLICIIYLIMV